MDVGGVLSSMWCDVNRSVDCGVGGLWGTFTEVELSLSLDHRSKLSSREPHDMFGSSGLDSASSSVPFSREL